MTDFRILMVHHALANNSHANRGTWAHTKSLEEPRRHVAAVRAGDRGAYRRHQSYDGTDDKNDTPPVDVCQRRPEKRAKSKPERGYGDCPVDLGIADAILILDLLKRWNRCGGDVGKQEISTRMVS